MSTSARRPLAEVLGEFVVGFDLRSSSKEPLVEKAKLHILDGIGVALAASTMEDGFASKLLRSVMTWKSAPECTVIGFRERAAPPLAAFVNGSLIHGCEFDDRYLERVVHTESFGVPVALALAEQRGLDGWALMEGWLIAAEVAIRLARGCNEASGSSESGSLNDSGFHTTSIFGTIGAAAAAAKLLGLDAERVATAMSLAVSFASGTSQAWGEASGRNKPIQPGWAAMSGLMAAQMSEAGYECAHSTLDGPRGLFAAHAWKNGWSAEPVLEELGTTWKCLDIAFKIFPSAGMIHNSIECTRQLVFEHDIRPEEVEAVDVTVASQYASQFEHGKQESRRRPASGYAAHGSWACNVARMILSREIGLQHLTLAAVQDPTMLALADKVTVRAGSEGGYPADERPTTVKIRTGRGTFERTLRKSAGNPEDVGRGEVVSKFQSNARLVLPDRTAGDVVDLVLSLETADPRAIAGLLTP